MKCKKCGNDLSGRQLSFCSIKCSRNYLKAQYRKRNRDKINTYNRQYRKTKEGQLVAGVRDECYFCGNYKNLQSHHTNYRPEKIVKLCQDCHRKLHKII